MMSQASAFATSPAGYISGIVIPAVLAVVVWLGQRSLNRIDGRFLALERSNVEASAALTANTQALAIIVERLAPMQTSIVQHTSKLTSLGEATAVLKQRMDTHEEWARSEHDRAMRGLS